MTKFISAEELAKELAVEWQSGMPQHENTCENLEKMVLQAIKTATEPLEAKISEMQSELSVGKAADRFSIKMDDLQQAKGFNEGVEASKKYVSAHWFKLVASGEVEAKLDELKKEVI